MPTDLKKRIVWLCIAGALVGGAVVVRVWLAATGGYSKGALAISLRVASGVGLLAGLVLAGIIVAWPLAKGSQTQGNATKQGESRKDGQ